MKIVHRYEALRAWLPFMDAPYEEAPTRFVWEQHMISDTNNPEKKPSGRELILMEGKADDIAEVLDLLKPIWNPKQ